MGDSKQQPLETQTQQHTSTWPHTEEDKAAKPSQHCLDPVFDVKVFRPGYHLCSLLSLIGLLGFQLSPAH